MDVLVIGLLGHEERADGVFVVFGEAERLHVRDGCGHGGFCWRAVACGRGIVGDGDEAAEKAAVLDGLAVAICVLLVGTRAGGVVADLAPRLAVVAAGAVRATHINI